MSTEPLCKVGDRTDFIGYISGRWPYPSQDANLVGTVTEVIRGPVISGVQCEHQYIIKSGHQFYRVAESQVSTPYGECDD